MRLQILQKICQGIWEAPSKIVNALFLLTLFMFDTITGIPYNRCLLHAMIFIIGMYLHFHIDQAATRFLLFEDTLMEKRVVLNKHALANFFRKRHNDKTTPLRDLVEKHYGIKAVVFIERYI